MFDPYQCLARLFSTRFSLTILMVGVIAWDIILLGLSSWEYESVSGDIALVKWYKGASYNNWQTKVCTQAPYVYLSPFSFTFQQTNTTTAVTGVNTKVTSKQVILNTTTKTKCGWPSQNSSLRLTMCVFSLLCVVALMFRTRFSSFAGSICAFYSFMFFVAFVIDANSTYVGLSVCQAGFAGTTLGVDMTAAGVIPACDLADYSGLTFITFLVSFLFGLLGAAWGLCKEPYASGETKLDNTRMKNISMDESVESRDASGVDEA
jgi:hypothetical protein